MNHKMRDVIIAVEHVIVYALTRPLKARKKPSGAYGVKFQLIGRRQKYIARNISTSCLVGASLYARILFA